MKRLITLFLLLVIAVTSVTGAPTTGAAADVTSNGFNTSVTGITGGTVWVMYGGVSGIHNWKGGETDVTGSSATIEVKGGAMLSNRPVYFVACDETGCDASEETATLLAVTTIPTMVGVNTMWTNISRSGFDIKMIGWTLMQTYTQMAPLTVVIGFAAMMLMIGLFMRTKTTRTALTVGLLLLAFLVSSSAGLYVGLPAVASVVIGGFVALALTGIAITLMKR